MCSNDEVLPVVNTHVHMPPNYSAYETLGQVMLEAQRQCAAGIGISNFYDQSVYAEFAAKAKDTGFLPLYGLEFITLEQDLAEQNIKVNDPANPGRIYFCGKGINPFQQKSAEAKVIAERIRHGNDARAEQMITQISAHFQACGLDTGLTREVVEKQVAVRGQVPVEWVSLQERHIARAYQEAVCDLPEDQAKDLIEKVYGQPPVAEITNAFATQAEIRSRLLKAGTVGFVPEVPLRFVQAKQYVLEMDGIPCYPILADGGGQDISEFEWPPAKIAANLLERGVYLAEIIPNRNAASIVDRYVAELNQAGILVVMGTEHNTQEKIPLLPRCADGPLSSSARKASYYATCVVAGHQSLVTDGKLGFVDSSGQMAGNISIDNEQTKNIAELGDSLLRQAYECLLKRKTKLNEASS